MKRKGTFIEVLQKIQTSSKIEEMLILMLKDERIEGISFEDKELHERSRNLAGNFQNGKNYSNWTLSNEQDSEFFEKLIEQLPELEHARVSSSIIQFEDVYIVVDIQSLVHQSNVIQIYKKSERESD